MNLRYNWKNYLNLTTHPGMGMDIITWMRLLKRHRYAIDVRYFPKALFMTANILINAPLQAFEHWRYDKSIRKTKVERPLFILGIHRSGTTFLHYVLGKDPQFAYCTTYEGVLPHIFLTAGVLTRNILQAAMPSTRPQDNVRAGAKLPIEEEFAIGNIGESSFVHGLYFPNDFYEVLDRSVCFTGGAHDTMVWQSPMMYLSQKLALKNPGKVLLLKSPSNTARIKEILEIYPDARFIHIHRNPYDVYQSTIGLFEKILPVVGLQRTNAAFMEEFVLHKYERMHRKYFAERHLIPQGNLYEMSYESFVADPLDHLRKAYHTLDLGDAISRERYFLEELKATSDYKTNTYASMDVQLKDKIARRWGFAFDAFGYTK